jgi:hypothetical protein
MTIKPINNKVRISKEDNESNVESFMDDNVVVVAFPSCLWNAIKDASEKLEISTNEVLGNAIKEYCNRNSI